MQRTRPRHVSSVQSLLESESARRGEGGGIDDREAMARSIELARLSAEHGPSVRMCDHRGRGSARRIRERGDDRPGSTGHAEIAAIRLACRTRGKLDLADCTLYTSCEPC